MQELGGIPVEVQPLRLLWLLESVPLLPPSLSPIWLAAPRQSSADQPQSLPPALFSSLIFCPSVHLYQLN